MTTIHIFTYMKLDWDQNINHSIMATWKRHGILWWKGNFFLVFENIHLLHHCSLIFEGLFWVALVDLIPTDVFKLGLSGFTINFWEVFTYYITQLCILIYFIQSLIHYNHVYTVVGQICHFIMINECQIFINWYNYF